MLLLDDHNNITHMSILVCGAQHTGKSGLIRSFLYGPQPNSNSNSNSNSTNNHNRSILTPYSPTIEEAITFPYLPTPSNSSSSSNSSPSNSTSNDLPDEQQQQQQQPQLSKRNSLLSTITHFRSSSSTSRSSSPVPLQNNQHQQPSRPSFSSTTTSQTFQTAHITPELSTNSLDRDRSSSSFYRRPQHMSVSTGGATTTIPTLSSLNTTATISSTSTSSFPYSRRSIVTNIMEIGGHPSFQSLLPSAISTADAFLIVYDIGDSRSFAQIWDYYRRISEIKLTKMPVMIIGSMLDTLTPMRQRQVSPESIKELSNLLGGVPIYETTAKAPNSIQQIFKQLIDLTQTWCFETGLIEYLHNSANQPTLQRSLHPIPYTKRSPSLVSLRSHLPHHQTTSSPSPSNNTSNNNNNNTKNVFSYRDFVYTLWKKYDSSLTRSELISQYQKELMDEKVAVGGMVGAVVDNQDVEVEEKRLSRVAQHLETLLEELASFDQVSDEEEEDEEDTVVQVPQLPTNTSLHRSASIQKRRNILQNTLRSCLEPSPRAYKKSSLSTTSGLLESILEELDDEDVREIVDELDLIDI